jgi:hypothetical protein
MTITRGVRIVAKDVNDAINDLSLTGYDLGDIGISLLPIPSTSKARKHLNGQ